MWRLACSGVLALVASPLAQAAVDCSALAGTRAPVQLPATLTAPVAGELHARHAQLGMPSGVLAAPFSYEQSAARVLQRLRVENCQPVAATVQPVPAAAVVATAADPAAYKPQTEFDNTPWRFDMSQNGRRMTAEEFDAWMQARGVRVVKARPAAVPAPVEPAEDANK